jgi:hypothetical protein
LPGDHNIVIGSLFPHHLTAGDVTALPAAKGFRLGLRYTSRGLK